MKKNYWWRTILSITIAIIHFLPFYIVVTVALKPKTDLSSYWKLPTTIHVENFTAAIEQAGVLTAIGNSLIITFVGVFLVMVFGAMAAYPLARNKTKFNAVILNFVVAMMMVPPLSILVPLIRMVSKMGGSDEFWSIIIILVTYQLPLSIFLYANFIRTIPNALDEAASIDGCSKFTVFYKIILPLLKPVSASVVILTGVFIWNDYQFSLYLFNDLIGNKFVVTNAVASFFAGSSNDFGAAAAAALIAILPVTLLYLFLQKYFVQGMVDSAVKG